ncbi:MAG: lysophospholipid acyltransferase family protein [Melioribacteraceae bacterium]
MLNKYKLEYFSFKFLGKLLSVFGFRNLKYSAKFLAFIFFNILRIRRKVVIKNLTIAFPHLDKKTIEKLAFKNYSSVAITFLEILNIEKMNRDEILSMVSQNYDDIIQLKIFQNPIYKDQGVILLTAHIGNWELGAIAAGIFLNKSINVLVKNQKNIYVRDWIKGIREKFGNKQITVGTSVREIFKALKMNKTVGIVGDQRGPRDGVKVNFFSRKTSVFVGTASIALKVNCPVIIAFCIRNSEHKYDIILEEMEIPNNQLSTEEKILLFNQNYMSFLEKTIKLYPDQWLWMHNIWKY